jgi:hypothetical protein
MKCSLTGLDSGVQFAQTNGEHVHRHKVLCRAVGKLDGYFGLFPLRHHVWNDLLKKCASAVGIERPFPLRLSTHAAQLSANEPTGKKLLDAFECWLVAHLYFYVDVFPFRKARPDAAFAVDDSSEPRFFNFGHISALWPGLDTGLWWSVIQRITPPWLSLPLATHYAPFSVSFHAAESDGSLA